MTKPDLGRASRFLALVLRHDPAAAGVTLDQQGWTDAGALLHGLRARGHDLTADHLATIVATDAKGRYSLSPDGTRIRANQGHSVVAVSLDHRVETPPDHLYHGTAEPNLAPILAGGLRRMSRHHVHLSPDRDTALTVGRRHGRPVVLRVRSGDMARDGHVFLRSENGVWLTDHVPPQFLEVEKG
ncbi:RNA 2'-phosphotransferase [Muricoccus radiodurans]|uniref:RNA 2'-phosphotransferase n=1 Tax=Muricoccus radiodurans TaxID=2231721 RepID=UPI003CE95C1F